MVAHPLTPPLPPAQTPLPAPPPPPPPCVFLPPPPPPFSHFPPPPRDPHCAYASLVPDFSCPITANEHQFAQPRAHRFRARVRVPCARAGSWPSSPLCCLLRLVPRFAPPEASTRVLEPLCAHARDTRGLRSPPRTLPTPYRPIEQCSIYRTWPGQTKVGTQLS